MLIWFEMIAQIKTRDRTFHVRRQGREPRCDGADGEGSFARIASEMPQDPDRGRDRRSAFELRELHAARLNHSATASGFLAMTTR